MFSDPMQLAGHALLIVALALVTASPAAAQGPELTGGAPWCSVVKIRGKRKDGKRYRIC